MKLMEDLNKTKKDIAPGRVKCHAIENSHHLACCTPSMRGEVASLSMLPPRDEVDLMWAVCRR